MTDGSSPTDLSKDKQSDLVRGTLPSRGDRQWLQRRVSGVSGHFHIRKAIIPKFPEDPSTQHTIRPFPRKRSWVSRSRLLSILYMEGTGNGG
jgi:hypothetical protein